MFEKNQLIAAEGSCFIVEACDETSIVVTPYGYDEQDKKFKRYGEQVQGSIKELQNIEFLTTSVVKSKYPITVIPETKKASEEFKCENCEKVFKTQETLEKHMKKEHPVTTTQPPENPELPPVNPEQPPVDPAAKV